MALSVRFTRRALDHLGALQGYVAQERPATAAVLGQRVISAINGLEQFPFIGRSGRVSGTRELVISGTPFLAVYRVNPPAVDILAILHGAQKWPEAF